LPLDCLPHQALEARSLQRPDDFGEIDLTVLSDVAANGVQTIISVSEEGMELCKKSMTTLLQSYVIDRAPSEWKGLFKEATNIAFMVKYVASKSPPDRLEIASDGSSIVSDGPSIASDRRLIASDFRYMFRESLPIAKQKFTEAIGKKTYSSETKAIMTNLVQETLAAYGNTGIYDPERLAEIDFLNHPEELVELVSRSKVRANRL
jgi:hypothetical protein